MTDQEYKEKILVIRSREPFGFRNTLAFIDDEKLIIDNSKYVIERWLYGLFVTGMGIFGAWALYKQPQSWKLEIILGNVTVILAILLCLIILINVILNTERKFIFNRLDGTLTMRSSVLNWIPKTITIPFEETRIGISGTPIAKSVNVRLPNSKFRHLTIMMVRDFIDETNFMSFIVWYMDRNRPLPLGEDLDPYREKDYQRRKAEGFPLPLYQAGFAMTDVDGDTTRYKK